MKADALLVKRSAGGQIEDIILIENKLSATTAYTERQKEAWALIKQNGQIKVQYQININGIVLEKGQILNIPTSKSVKIADHGNETLSSLTNSDIDFINFSPY